MLSHFCRVQLWCPMDCSLPGSSVHRIPQQEYWSGLPCPPPGDLPNPGIKLESPVAPALKVDSLPLSHQGSPHLSIYTNWNYIEVEREFKDKLQPLTWVLTKMTLKYIFFSYASKFPNDCKLWMTTCYFYVSSLILSIFIANYVF